MQIKIDVKILLLAIIFYISGQLTTYIFLMFFGFIHEMAHFFVGKILGFKLYQLEVRPVGFCVSFIAPIDDYNKKLLASNILELKKIFIYFAGPIVNVIIASFFYLLHINGNFSVFCIYINLILAFGNLIPIYPLDGGRILKSFICLICGRVKSYKLTEIVSRIFLIIILIIGSIVILKVHNIGLVVVLFYITYMKIKQTQIFEYKTRLFE